MLEGAIARVLNQFLGKYVTDLDTENLNVGIFSGQVQLTDIKLKVEALYELNLPVEVKAGTIGKIRLQIPWTSIWNSPIILLIEDLHIIFGPIINNEPFDAEKNKRLVRASKKKILEDLENNNNNDFMQLFVVNILNNLQVTINNIHIRYEDLGSFKTPIGAGLTIGSITAENVNNKWKPSSFDPNSSSHHYLIKIDAFSVYWNDNIKPKKWNFPAEYYNWRNAMARSLENYTINNENLNFLIKPLTTKIKIALSKNGSINCSTDLSIQDCNIQINKNQYESVLAVKDSLSRMAIAWNFIHLRPPEFKTVRNWWKYAYFAVVEQRIKPYTWSRIRFVRQQFRLYREAFKKILQNPNDTELKLDLQIYEDNLSILNIIIARKIAKLSSDKMEYFEKNFWSSLPSPEKLSISRKIGYKQDQSLSIKYKFNIRFGHTNLSLIDGNNREVVVATLTNVGLNLTPNFSQRSYKLLFKIEGLIVEGASSEETLVQLAASEHLGKSPAYFFRLEMEKMEKGSNVPYKFNLALDSVEVSYNSETFHELNKFLRTDQHFEPIDFLNLPNRLYQKIARKVQDKWEVTLNVKVPVVVIPELGNISRSEHLLVIDLGRYLVTTEISENISLEDATPSELEERIYNKLNIEATGIQVLFCNSKDNWKEAKDEKDTLLHLLSKTEFSAMYARVDEDKIKPGCKFSINFQHLKMNLSERRIMEAFKFFQNFNIESFHDKICKDFISDKITQQLGLKYLKDVESKVILRERSFATPIRKLIKQSKKDKIKLIEYTKRENMNENWARNVDLPGLEDNISPTNYITVLFRFVVNEFSIHFSRSTDSTDRPYLILKFGCFTMDLALMAFGPAYQISLNSILLTDKSHTNSSGQYIDLLHSPVPSNVDLITVLYRRVNANCPDFWSHFHGVETSLVVDFGTINLLLHQEVIHTANKYFKYFYTKISSHIKTDIWQKIYNGIEWINKRIHKKAVPVPQGSIKFSYSGRLGNVNVRVCDSDFDLINVEISGLELDFLFRANERFVFRSFLSFINVEHLSDVTLYSKVFTTDEDKVFEMKYVRNALNIDNKDDVNGSYKLNLGKIHITFLYKLIVQLQRFLSNLEATQYFTDTVNWISSKITKATDTLTKSEKINLSINVCGPVLLLPQKSSSPNVIVVDTGELHVENFFKDYGDGAVENILFKWKGITITRGVMTLSYTLEMQESLVEPININLDIKKNIKNTVKSWDVDGVLDPIQITLGQKDISTITSIYGDNIGEGNLNDLFPSNKTTPVMGEEDETVKSLEAFFSEPKQKNLLARFRLEEISLVLFFDSGELLSSPIRDLNHGLCKFIVSDIGTNFVLYNDKSIDGKLSIDKILIEEIGPDVTVSFKKVLQSVDDNKNNNFNITINKPPIVDLNFHQNQSKDRSVDIIIGRLSLNLSVPFCEKLALFILECLPKTTSDRGIINQGYEGEIIASDKKFTSLTLSLRINKPEVIFIVESSSSKRCFITHAEILTDYSRHNNRLNLVISLSGLHSLYHDGTELGNHYLILKHCDVEFSNCYSDDKGQKIIAAISAIHVQICSKVIHSMTDILNDIAEHFRVPELESVDRKNAEFEEMWEPKKLASYICANSDPNKLTKSYNEIFLMPKFEFVLMFELEEAQVLLLKSTSEITIYNWSSSLNSTCEFTIQANYFNENLQTWEPFIDPVVSDEKQYKPWEVLVKVFQDKAMPILDVVEKAKNKTNAKERSSGTSEEEDSGDMMYLEPVNFSKTHRRVKTSLSTFLDDSDSENEDGAMEKLASAISDLFTGDWNETEESDISHSSEEDDEESIKTQDQEQDRNQNYLKAIFLLVEAKEKLNITVTPSLIKVLNELIIAYSNKTISIIGNKHTINLVNDIGPQSKIEFFEKQIDKDFEKDNLVCLKTFENLDSPPKSPKLNYFQEPFDDCNDERDCDDDFCKGELEISYDYETLASLQFPTETAPQLYQKINKNFIKIHIPDFPVIQTNCPQKKWQKLMKVSGHYYLAARHNISKYGRNLVVSSPLQIRNETCFALSILYQPSVLQQLNLEPVGEVTNPFETTMRIAVLEAHEQYNVPLYIAYHCKLFVQPAYAEGHYTSDSGIWWKDLATELDVAHNLRCYPKSESNVEIFSLRVMLQRNLKTTNSKAHSIPNYIIHLLPPLIFHNFLPYIIEVENVGLKQQVKVEPGEKRSIYSLDISKEQKLMIKAKHKNITWTGVLKYTNYLEEKIIILLNESENSGDRKNLSISVRADREGSCQLYFFTHYWINNKTSLPLQFRAAASNAIYESNNEDILLFSFKRHGKQTMNLKVYESNWSNEFGLECAGTTGLIICKDNERKKKYMFFLDTKLSQMCPRLTRIVTLLPSFVVVNSTNKSLRFMENNEKTDLWTDLAPNQTTLFWPETNSFQMYVKYKDSKLISQCFPFATPNHTVLRMDKGVALCVEVSGGQNGPFKINFRKYKTGDAPILVKNYCVDLFLKIQQKNQSQVTLLNPNNSLLYTWDDPAKSRDLIWNVYNNKGPGFSIDVLRDSHGEEKVVFHSVNPSAPVSSSEDDEDENDSNLNKVRRDKIVIYWLCYRDALQRVLLFTQELKIYNDVLNNYFLEHSNFEVFISFSGVGLSIFTDDEEKRREHFYALLEDNPAVWEVNVGEKWKTLTLELASWIEDKYRLHYKKCQLKDYIHIDFDKMYMLKPFFAELRRTYNPAIYFQWRKSINYQSFSLKLQNIQIDNKLSKLVIFQPLATVNNMKGLNPLIDLTISKKYNIYRYIKLNVKSFHLNIENGIFLDLEDLFKNRKFQTETTICFINDMKTIRDDLFKNVKSSMIVEYLNISNFDVHLNISNKKQIGLNQGNIIVNNFLEYLFPINIAPYMPFEGVFIRISSIEDVDVNTQICTILHQLKSKFLQQYYSQILGLQVLVNPFAATPVPGMSLEPEKSAGILLYGFRCLLSHVNMSPTALEQCVIDIFANQTLENIQRIRRHGSYQCSDSLPKTLLLPFKSFNCGVPIALNQLIVKSENSGFTYDGETFFRTTGKVLLSIMMRHHDEKTDAVEVAKEALRRAYLMGEPIKIQSRLMRYGNQHLGLKPFSAYESMGSYLLEAVANCRFICDHYWAHAAVDRLGRSVILISLEHVIRINKSRLWGAWEVEWVLEIDDLLSLPKISDSELIFSIRQEESLETIKVVGEKNALVWIHDKIEQAIIVSMEDKSWSSVAEV